MAENRSANPDAPAHAIGQLRFVDEQQVVHDLAGDAAHHRGDPFLFAGSRRERRMQQWICGARLPAGTSEKVGHADLVSEHQVRDDVARERAIAVGVKQPFDRRTVAPVRAVERGDVIAHVRRGTRCFRSRTSRRSAD